MMESRYQKLKNAGLCVRCGKTRDRDVAYCSACCKKHTDENKTEKNGTQKITFALFAEKKPYTETKSNVWLADTNTTIFKKFIGSKIG